MISADRFISSSVSNFAGAEFDQPGVARIARLAFAQRGDTRVHDMPWRSEVGFADAERHDIFHRGGDVEVLTNTGRAKLLYPLCDEISHLTKPFCTITIQHESGADSV